VLAMQLALEYGLALNLAGGTHHAHAGFGSGFTILNDLAVAARAAQACEGVGRVCILDADVHQVCVKLCA
jgi:acetoin utilization deacetylase AcuC-like enzyme